MPTLTLKQDRPSQTRTVLIFTATVVASLVLFALPNLFLGITKFNGGLTGINLLFIALFQLAGVGTLVYFSLKTLGKNFRYIGWTSKHWKLDLLLGLAVGLLWAAIQFIWLIPNTGGAERADVSRMVDTMDGSIIGLLSYVALGVIGGGITEEILFRGYFIGVLKDTFRNQKVGLWVAAGLSLLLFALGHMPTDVLSWIDILIPSVAYTLLFIYTRRLTAPIIAHGIYNAIAIILTYQMYY